MKRARSEEDWTRKESIYHEWISEKDMALVASSNVISFSDIHSYHDKKIGWTIRLNQKNTNNYFKGNYDSNLKTFIINDYFSKILYTFFLLSWPMWMLLLLNNPRNCMTTAIKQADARANCGLMVRDQSYGQIRVKLPNLEWQNYFPLNDHIYPCHNRFSINPA